MAETTTTAVEQAIEALMAGEATPEEEAEGMQYAPGWTAEEDDVLAGIVTSRDTREWDESSTRERFDPYEVITVRVIKPGCTEEGGTPIKAGLERGFHAQGNVARSKIEKLDPQVGEILYVVYEGKIPSKANPGRSYHNYVIRVRDAQGQPKTIDE